MSVQTKIPHTASFLQAFHTGGGNLPADIDDNAAEYALAASDLLDLVPTEAPAFRPSPAQTALISKLILEINALNTELSEQAASYTARMDREGAWTRENTSRWIGRLIAKANELRAAAPAPTGTVADGRYAVVEDGVLRFFRVKNGRIPGFVFLDIQASDDWHSIHNVARIRKILASIAVDAHGAMVRYGQELGQCGRCGKALTSEYRKLGLGPVCIEK